MFKNLFATSLLLLITLSNSHAFNLTSSSFKAFTTLPQAQVCKDQNGGNISPELSWSDVPKKTKAFVLFVHDPDAPHLSGFVHWVVYLDNNKITHLNQGLAASPKQGIYFGLNGLDKNAYMGACPPAGSGIHRYNFTLYALNSTLETQEIASLHQNEILNKISNSIIDQAVLTGFYKNQTS